MAFHERIYNLDTVLLPRQAGREGSVATEVACYGRSGQCGRERGVALGHPSW